MSQSPSNERLRAQIHRMILSEDDFYEAEKYLLCFEQKLIDNENIKRALLLAAIISFARSFLKSEDHPKAVSKLPKNVTRIFLNDDERELHQKIISLRNQALAHSDYNYKPVIWSGGVENGFSFQASSFNLLSEEIDIKQFLLLARKLKGYCTSKQFELNSKVINNS